MARKTQRKGAKGKRPSKGKPKRGKPKKTKRSNPKRDKNKIKTKKNRRPEGGRAGKKGKRPGRGRAGKGAKQGGRGRKSSGGSSRKFLGRIQKNPQGFAFIISDDINQPDIYVSRRDATPLMDDDRVEYSVNHGGYRASAEIHRILQRGRTRIIGVVHESDRGRVVQDTQGNVFRLEKGRARDGDWVLADIDKYPTQSRAGTVQIDQNLGRELSPSHDYDLAIAQFDITVEFSNKALDQAEEARERATRNPGERRDLRDKPMVTVDGADAKDFDDAILVEGDRHGYRLYVAIADVSHFVEPGSALDKEARARATSIYFPGRCIPMLPEDLSNDACSLRPKVDRFALVAEIPFDRNGNAMKPTFYEAVIRTSARLTYDEVQEFIDGNPPEKTRPVRDALEKARELFKLMLKKRRERGVLDFELPECRMELDEDGRPVKVYPAKRLESMRWIEEFMIAANSVVARTLREAGIPTLYRVHETPSPESVDELNSLLRDLGIATPLRGNRPRDFARLLEETKKVKGAATLHQAILRKQQQARYEPLPRGHFGLSLKDYAHFTSPIRRYPDLVVHRSLKQLIFQHKKPDKRSESPESLEALGAATSDRERAAAQAERFVVKRKQCWFMLDHIGDRFEGIIAGVIERGVFVEIPEFALDGFVPVDGLPGYWEFDEARNCMRKRPGHDTLSVGDSLYIEVAEVSLETNQITFVAPE